MTETAESCVNSATMCDRGDDVRERSPLHETGDKGGFGEEVRRGEEASSRRAGEDTSPRDKFRLRVNSENWPSQYLLDWRNTNLSLIVYIP